VSHVDWVLPVNNDKLYGGKNNLLIWTEHPDAESYMMEFNLPVPAFSEENVSTPEFTKQSIELPVGSFVKFEDLIVFSLPFPDGDYGFMLELRIFALDSAGNVIGESVSSDRNAVFLTD